MHNDRLIGDPRKVANNFNEHFAKIGSKIGNKIPHVSSSFRDYVTKRNRNGKPFINPNSVSFFLSPITPGEIELIINCLNTSKSSWPSSIPISILKRFNLFLSVWLDKLINLSFVSGSFSDVLKIAQFTPILKKGSKLNCVNYRPISLLSVFSKMFEKLIYSRIYSFLVKNNLIFSKQFGFRSGYAM